MAARRKRWAVGETFRAFVEGLDDEQIWAVRQFADHLAKEDSPTVGDLSHVFDKYLTGSEEFRKGVDQAFKWWTGYGFDAVIAQTFFGHEWKKAVEGWRHSP